MQNFGSAKSTFGLDSNIVAGLCYVANLCCYLGLILSIITVIQDKTNKLARFHAFQSILLSAAGLLLGIVVNILSGVALAANSTALSILIGVLALLVGLTILVGIIIAAVNGFQGKVFKLPVIGDLADKWSN